MRKAMFLYSRSHDYYLHSRRILCMDTESNGQVQAFLWQWSHFMLKVKRRTHLRCQLNYQCTMVSLNSFSIPSLPESTSAEKSSVQP